MYVSMSVCVRLELSNEAHAVHTRTKQSDDDKVWHTRKHLDQAPHVIEAKSNYSIALEPDTFQDTIERAGRCPNAIVHKHTKPVIHSYAHVSVR